MEVQQIQFQGEVLRSKNHGSVENPKLGFKNAALETLELFLEFSGQNSPVFGSTSFDFAQSHYEQHVVGVGSILINSKTLLHAKYLPLRGLWDHSWGSRSRHNTDKYRHFNAHISDSFRFSVILMHVNGKLLSRGTLFLGESIFEVDQVLLQTRYDDNERLDGEESHDWVAEHREFILTLASGRREFAIQGRILSFVPLRNQTQLETSYSVEAMT